MEEKKKGKGFDITFARLYIPNKYFFFPSSPFLAYRIHNVTKRLGASSSPFAALSVSFPLLLAPRKSWSKFTRSVAPAWAAMFFFIIIISLFFFHLFFSIPNVHRHGPSPFVWRRHAREERDPIDVDTVVEMNLQIIPQSCLGIAIALFFSIYRTLLTSAKKKKKNISCCLALLVGIRLSMYREVSIKPRGGETSSGEDNKRLSEPPDATRKRLDLRQKAILSPHRRLVVIKSK